MLHQKNIPIEENQTSTEKNEYQFLYKKDEELKDDIITVGNEGNFEHGIDFRNCKTILDRD